jgi:hypothetical protein
MLPDTGRATPDLLREVLRLAQAGAIVAAPRPLTRAHGLVPDATVAALWEQIAATGNLVLTATFDVVERRLGLVPDLAHDRTAGSPRLSAIDDGIGAAAPLPPPLLWIHRTDDAGADWYFLSNQTDEAGPVRCTFRVTGRQPELWDAATGRRRDAAVFAEREGRTTVEIPFDPRGSWFVVFRRPASKLAVPPAAGARRDLWLEDGRVVEERVQPGAQILEEGWTLTFAPNRGAPAELRLDRLTDLSGHADEGVRHFSGTMIYRKGFTLPPKGTTPASQWILDLGAVANLAEVVVNGRSMGVLWKQPFRVDLTAALREGANDLEIRVTNLWVNRLVGDAQQMGTLGVTYDPRNGVIKKWPAWVPRDAPPPGAPVSFATWRQWTGKEPLRPSGLIGPVTLQVVTKTPVSL